MIRVRQIKCKLEEDINDIKIICSKKLKINVNDIKDIIIRKKSLDARHKPNLYYVYEVDIKINNEDKILKNNKDNNVLRSPDEKYLFKVTGKKVLKNKPIIVGAGPAGLFCAYYLSKYGYNPIVIERGEDIENRVKKVEEFFKTGILDINSNVQFGEGGAGTFSDGKLNTLIKDKRVKEVLKVFVECGAPKEILYLNKPHIGTDLLRNVIINMRNKIINNGGEFRYNTCLTNINYENNKLISIEINNKETIKCDNLILAIGHSARDTFKMFKDKLIMSPKAFAVGIRIQHKQSLINNNQYGSSINLPAASYKLTYKASNGRGVYSFCMCPGGYVVNSSSELNHLVINGMSNHRRDSKNANSAIVVTVTPDDFGFNVLDGLEYQRKLESNAYKYGNGKIPIQLFKDYLDNKKSTSYNSIKPIMKGNYSFSNINEILPDYINKSLKEAIKYFDRLIPGFANDDVILAAVESRTSSPIRIERNNEYQSNIKGIYPCGEGAGYAGGITSAAIDGIKIAEQIASVYIPRND